MWDPFADEKSVEELRREEDVRRQRLERERRRMRMIFGAGGEGEEVVSVDGVEVGRQEPVEFELVVRLK